MILFAFLAGCATGTAITLLVLYLTIDDTKIHDTKTHGRKDLGT